MFGRAETLIPRRRQQTTSWAGTDVGSPRGRRRWHAGTEQHGTGETLPGSLVGQVRAYKVGRLKVRGAGRESERPDVPVKACKTTRWREGALLLSCLQGGKCEGMPGTANTPNEKVRELQRKLYVCAKRSRTRRFHALYDRIYRSDVLWEAWRRVRSNRGAAGVDAETIQAIEKRGVGEFLAEIEAALRAGRYRPSPVKRRYIPKGEGKQRPLGILRSGLPAMQLWIPSEEKRDRSTGGHTHGRQPGLQLCRRCRHSRLL